MLQLSNQSACARARSSWFNQPPCSAQKAARLRATQPLFVDDYSRNLLTGGFILIDEATHGTVAATPEWSAARGRREAQVVMPP